MITNVTFLVSVSVLSLLLRLKHTDKPYQPDGDTYLRYSFRNLVSLADFPSTSSQQRRVEWVTSDLTLPEIKILYGVIPCEVGYPTHLPFITFYFTFRR